MQWADYPNKNDWTWEPRKHIGPLSVHDGDGYRSPERVVKLLQTRTLPPKTSGRNDRLNQASRHQGPTLCLRQAHWCSARWPPPRRRAARRRSRARFFFFLLPTLNLGTGSVGYATNEELPPGRGRRTSRVSVLLASASIPPHPARSHLAPRGPSDPLLSLTTVPPFCTRAGAMLSMSRLFSLALVLAAGSLADRVHAAAAPGVQPSSDGSAAVVLSVAAQAESYRPFLGVGYDVLGFDFEQGAQPLVLSTFKKRWADANASWARMVNPTTFWTYVLRPLLPLLQTRHRHREREREKKETETHRGAQSHTLTLLGVRYNNSRFIADYASLFRAFSQTYGRLLTVILHINGVPCCWSQVTRRTRRSSGRSGRRDNGRRRVRSRPALSDWLSLSESLCLSLSLCLTLCLTLSLALSAF